MLPSTDDCWKVLHWGLGIVDGVTHAFWGAGDSYALYSLGLSSVTLEDGEMKTSATAWAVKSIKKPHWTCTENNQHFWKHGCDKTFSTMNMNRRNVLLWLTAIWKTFWKHPLHVWPPNMTRRCNMSGEERETNKMQLIRCSLSNFYLNMFRASLCPSSEEQDSVLLHMVFCTLTRGG